MISFNICTPHEHISESSIKKEMGERSDAQKVSVGKREGKRQLGRPGRRLKDNIGMDLKGISWEGTGWIDLAKDSGKCRTVVNAVMNPQVPQNAGNCLPI